MFRTLLIVVVIMASSASADVVLKVDFNSNQDGGGDSTAAGDPGLSAAAHNQEGWSSYHANHEVAAEFSTANYGGITVTPDWPNTTDNRVRQSIDRGNNQNDPPTGYDGNWDNAAGDINLVTDFIGIDTRTANGGNGNWDGVTGTPTYMTLTLGGLSAGTYECISFHHDTEHCHGTFAVWLSTDGGGTFTQLADGLMTDGTDGGTPDSATDGSYGLVTGPDAYTLPSVYTTSFSANGTDDVVLRFAPYSGVLGDAVHNQIWGMNGFELTRIRPAIAKNPSPADEASDVPAPVVLTWTPGDYAPAVNGHKVFLSDNLADVSGGLPAAERGTVNEPVFDTVAHGVALEYGTTYYWRVDEANVPGGTWDEGQVWSFTMEPYTIAIPGASITATADSNDTGQGPENTINGSGLDADDLHSNELTDMWLSRSGAPQPAWIRYEFDTVYKLDQMLVWNHNSPLEPSIGFGIRDATITYSLDGTNWTTLGTTHEFTRGAGAAGYPANTTVDFAGAVAKYVKLTANSNWSDIPGVTQCGLSEVRFFYLPVRARQPYPPPGETGMGVDNVTLKWSTGREAASHEVYFSANENAVIDETISPATVPANSGYVSYDTGELDLGRTYYWKVNEVSDAATPTTWEGDVWSFQTADFLVVDNFETYDDDYENYNRIFQVWIDGAGYTQPEPGRAGNGSGALVGTNSAPWVEQTIVHSGRQSMPLSYNNTVDPFYSESTRTFDAPQDWTKYGIKSLTLWFYGDPANSVTEQMYVKLNGSKVTYDGNTDDLTRTAWQECNIDLRDFSGVNLDNATEISIGFEPIGAVGGSGQMYFDDIRLYPARCVAELRQPGADLNDDCVVDYVDIEILANEWLGTGYEITPVSPGSAGLVAHWAFDDGAGTTAQDSSGNNNHGTVMGGAQWVAGKVGGALAFDGVDDMVVVEQNSGLPIYNNGTDNAYSVAMWVKGGPQPDMRVFSEGSTSDNNPLFNLGTQNAGDTGQFDVYIRPDTGTTLNHPLSQAEPFDYYWHHIGWVDDNGTARLYVDGVLDGTDFSYTRGTMALDTTSIGGILRANPSHFFTGQIDDVHVYNRALSQAEIAWLAGHTSPFSEPSDMYQDGTVDFKDFAALADGWLDEQLWPEP